MGNGHQRDNGTDMHFRWISSWTDPGLLWAVSQASRVVPQKEFIFNYLLHFLHLKMKKWRWSVRLDWIFAKDSKSIKVHWRITLHYITPNQHLNIDGITQNFRSGGGCEEQILALGYEGIGSVGEMWGQLVQLSICVWHPSSKDPSLPGEEMDR